MCPLALTCIVAFHALSISGVQGSMPMLLLPCIRLPLSCLSGSPISVPYALVEKTAVPFKSLTALPQGMPEDKCGPATPLGLVLEPQTAWLNIYVLKSFQ